MSSFKRRAAFRIAAVSLLLTAIASPIAWFIAREAAEEGNVLLAIEESRHLLQQSSPPAASEALRQARAVAAATTLTGALFDIAEIYDGQGIKLAKDMTPAGRDIEAALPGHDRPAYVTPTHESFRLAGNRWVLRVFVPLQEAAASPQAEITGYFEGVRVVPDWQRAQMLASALSAALMTAFASLACGLAIYPVVVRLAADNERKTREVLDSHLSIMEALGRAIAKRDSETGAHNYRVAWIAVRIGERMGLTDQAMQALIAGSFLHDIGKIAVPDAILHKPGKLDDDERSVMSTHVAQGEDIVTGIGWLEGAREVVAGHHERWDGSGYPKGLKGEEIPLAARIFSVADVFDALCSRRPYKDPMGFDAAMAVLREDAGSAFDPGVMCAFQAIAREVFERLAPSGEGEVRSLLADRVCHHFGL